MTTNNATDTTALDALIEAVEKGELHEVNIVLGNWFSLDHSIPWSTVSDINSAFRGSLDAAKALHEAMLPGWGYAFGDDEKGAAGVVARDLQSEEIEAHSEIPARAWLLATLKAYRASL